MNSIYTTQWLLAVTLVSGFATSPALAANTDKKAPIKTAAATPAPKAHVLKFDAREEGGKKVWIPATAAVKVNEPVTLEIHNSLTAPHGFKIEGYVQPQVIGANETKIVTFTPTKAGDLNVECQLHPVHVGATIKVQ